MNSNTETLIEKREEALRAALADLYATFGCYQAPERLRDAVPWCIDEDVNHDMCTLPLRDLKTWHFYEYNTENQCVVQPANEIKYFIPRMLELVVNREEINHSPELYLERLGQCEPDAISADERAAMENIALAYFAWGLEQWPDPDSPVLPYGNAFTILLMWDIAGLDITPLLAHWLDHEGAAPTLHYVEATYWNYLKEGRQVGMEFAKDRPQFRETLGGWLEKANNKARFAERIRTLKDDGHEKPWEKGFPNRGIERRIEAVLKAVSEGTKF